MQISKLVDDFVSKVNAQSREQMPVDEVPEYLREGPSVMEGYTSWRILKSDNSAAVSALQDRIQKRFPPSFYYFISNYSFPAFEFGPVMLFANTGQENFWELGKRLFADRHMSPALLRSGFIQIGSPYSGNYDPVCFDTKRNRYEHPIVRLDREIVIQRGKMKIIQEIAPSFIVLLKTPVEK